MVTRDKNARWQLRRLGALRQRLAGGGGPTKALVCAVLVLQLQQVAFACGGAWPMATESSPSLRDRLTGFRVGAHRGGMSFPDQNTIERFEQAKEAGVDIVETDLRASRDGEVFLFHDKRMENLTNCVGPIGEKTASEISRCKLRGTTLGLSTFRDLLAWSEGRVVINAELKNADAIEPAFRLVREYDAFRWVYFQVNGNYEKARAADPQVALLVAPKGPKAQEVLNHYLALGDPNLMIVELRPGLNTPGNIGAIHAAGKLVSEDSWYFGRERLWGARHAQCNRVFQHGIDIAISDIPAGCVQQRDEADLLLLR